MEQSKSGEQIDELKEKIAKLTEENAEMKGRIAQLLEQLEEKKQKRPMESTSSPPPLKQMKMAIEAESSDSIAKMDDKEMNESEKGKNIPNWLIEVLEWIKRIEMADSLLSTSSWTFKQLCWPKLHLNVKTNIVQPLNINSQIDEFGNLGAKLLIIRNKNWVPSVQIPIASTPPPNYIIGFKQIYVTSFLDGQILKIIENICPLLNTFHLSFNPIQLPFYCITNERIVGQIHYLFEMLALKAFSLYIPSFCDFMRFHPNANAIIENIQLIDTYLNQSNIDLLFKWVTQPRSDQKPKILRLEFSKDDIGTSFIERIKEEFSSATQSTNFILRLISGPMNCPAFVLENELTNEKLYHKFVQHRRKSIIRYTRGNETLLTEEWFKKCKRQDLPCSISVGITQIGEF